MSGELNRKEIGAGVPGVGTLLSEAAQPSIQRRKMSSGRSATALTLQENNGGRQGKYISFEAFLSSRLILNYKRQNTFRKASILFFRPLRLFRLAFRKDGRSKHICINTAASTCREAHSSSLPPKATAETAGLIDRRRSRAA